MGSLFRASFLFVKNAITANSFRSISVSPSLQLKEISVQKTNENVIVEGVYKPSPRTELLVHAENNTTTEGQKPCYMCALGLDVKHTDILILSQFVRTDGCMLPRRITGLCSRQQKKIGKMVSMAQKAGLMINLTPSSCKKNPRRRRDYKKFNTYFDESTIFMKRIPTQEDRFKR